MLWGDFHSTLSAAKASHLHFASRLLLNKRFSALQSWTFSHNNVSVKLSLQKTTFHFQVDGGIQCSNRDSWGHRTRETCISLKHRGTKPSTTIWSFLHRGTYNCQGFIYSLWVPTKPDCLDIKLGRVSLGICKIFRFNADCVS